jgi:hypothetical protein
MKLYSSDQKQRTLLDGDGGVWTSFLTSEHHLALSPPPIPHRFIRSRARADGLILGNDMGLSNTSILSRIISRNLAEDLYLISSGPLRQPLRWRNRVCHGLRIFVLGSGYPVLPPPQPMGFYRVYLLVTAGYMSKSLNSLRMYSWAVVEAFLACGCRSLLTSVCRYILCSYVYRLFCQKLALCFVEHAIQSTPWFRLSSLPWRKLLVLLIYLRFTSWVYVIGRFTTVFFGVFSGLFWYVFSMVPKKGARKKTPFFWRCYIKSLPPFYAKYMAFFKPLMTLFFFPALITGCLVSVLHYLGAAWRCQWGSAPTGTNAA